jgi:hypothetical protein
MNRKSFWFGFLFRRATNLKEAGERLRWNLLTRIGIRLKGWVLNHG